MPLGFSSPSPTSSINVSFGCHLAKTLHFAAASPQELRLGRVKMQRSLKFNFLSGHLAKGSEILAISSRFLKWKSCFIMSEDSKLGEFLDYMENLKNYERLGVPRDAGTDSDNGFDLGRMRRLLERLGNPHTRFRALHVAGTKGKGSTAAFLSNILREGGYSVGCYTSPHLLTIRERISFGRNGVPVSAEALLNVFHQIKEIIDHSVKMENGTLTYFEVFTAIAFALFSQEKVDFAVVEAGLGGSRDATNVLRNTELAASIITSIGEEHLAALGGSLESIAIAKSGIIKHGRPLVIGGPFEAHIERIIRDKAYSMNSPVVSACDPGIRSDIKFFGREGGRPYQTCAVQIQVKQDLKLFMDLPDVKLQMLGYHQLQNAVTATCAALCLRNQGHMISDKSIRAGLEQTQLSGRSQFLSQQEVEAVGASGASMLIDGAHTDASAKGLSDVIRMVYPDGLLAYVVAMASDKDHLAFARQLLRGRRPAIVLLTEVSIAGGKSRAAPASLLIDAWKKGADDVGLDITDIGAIDNENSFDSLITGSNGSTDNRSVMLAACPNLPISDIIKLADRLLRSRQRESPGLIVVTGSLHIVSSILAVIHK